MLEPRGEFTPQQLASMRLLLHLRAEKAAQVFRPQPGPQTAFLDTRADIALYGGAAGSGKSHALLLENLRHVDNPAFGSVIFRRESTQITTEGGLWDSAMTLYPQKGARPRFTPRHQMIFPSGAKVSFAHLQYEADVLAWQGSQVPLISYDELTHFTRRQFFYMLSRNRSTCGVRPYIRATTNPDADSWVAKLVDWWIDPDTGAAIAERSGVLRYFVVIDDEMRWADTRDELAATYGVRPEDTKSFTFIAASIFDNRILLDKDPAYLANLKALGTVDRARLLHGNWKIKPSAGMYFRRDQAQIVGAPPSNVVQVCRAWDLAATTPTPDNPSPDATAGVLIGRLDDGRYIVLDAVHGRWTSNDVRARVRNVAAADRDRYPDVRVRLPQDPGQAGKEQAQSYVAMLAGYSVKVERVTGGKVTRAEPFSSQWQAGNVLLLQGAWNDGFLAELEAFPEGAHDDLVDAAADAFSEVALNTQPIVESQVVSYHDLMSINYGDMWGLT
jgi:predicted phage terminase large subunit-like protein